MYVYVTVRCHVAGGVTRRERRGGGGERWDNERLIVWLQLTSIKFDWVASELTPVRVCVCDAPTRRRQVFRIKQSSNARRIDTLVASRGLTRTRCLVLRDIGASEYWGSQPGLHWLYRHTTYDPWPVSCSPCPLGSVRPLDSMTSWPQVTPQIATKSSDDGIVPEAMPIISAHTN